VDVLVALTEATYGATPNFEGLAVDARSKQLIATRYYNGSILQVSSQGAQEVQLFNQNIIQGKSTGIKVGKQGEKYICFHSSNPLYNGVWKFERDAKNCTSIIGGARSYFQAKQVNIHYSKYLLRGERIFYGQTE